MHNKPSALMISGSGRSGTTLLSLLLSQDPRVLNVGQLRDVWAGWAADVPCSCGRGLCSCDLWGKMRDVLFPDLPEQRVDASRKAMRAFMRDAAGREDWSDSATLADLSERHSAFIDILRRLLEALIEQTGASLVIDSSKSPEIALAFHLTGVVDVFVLNVVRDPRAVACSWAAKNTADVPSMMAAWLERQERLSAWKDGPGLQHRRMRYEDFVANPQPMLRDALAWVGETLPDTVFERHDMVRIDWTSQHLFPPANETMLREKREVLQIKAPEDWRGLRHWRLHATALFRTFPKGLAYVMGVRFGTGF